MRYVRFMSVNELEKFKQGEVLKITQIGQKEPSADLLGSVSSGIMWNQKTESNT